MVKLRNQMRLLSKYVSDEVLFVRRKGDSFKYRVVVHGMEKKLGVSAKAFAKMLNSGELFRQMPPDQAEKLARLTMEALAQKKTFEFDFTMTTPDGQIHQLHMKSDHVDDSNTKVEYICIFREV